MMKKILILALCMVLASVLVFAQGAQQGIHEPGTGLEDPELKAAGQGTGQGLDDAEDAQVTDEEESEDEETLGKELANIRKQLREKAKAMNISDLNEGLKLKAQELNLSLGQYKQTIQKVYQNQNKVRLAVHALLDMEELVGGIGKNVSAIAKEFNNSLQRTLRAEENIAKRGGFARFFVGGDSEAAAELEEKTAQNRERVNELNQLREQCEEECSEEVRALMQEQIQNMLQEQERLGELAQNEKKSKGILGWIWKRG